jgi:hypothetical protein
LHRGKALPWSFAGYGLPTDVSQLEDKALAEDRALVLVTPATTLAVLHQGFRPVWHPSAEA